MKFTDEDIRIKRLFKKDLSTAAKLFMLFNNVFDEGTPIAETTHLLSLLNNSGFICLAASYKNEIIGGLTAYELPMYLSTGAQIYIYDIAVKPEFQRKGVGKKILLAIKDYSLQKGIKTIFVDANVNDEHALDFYRSTHASEEKVIQFTYTNL